MGLLDLEGQLTRILVSLVSKDSLMLDGLDDASIEIKEVNEQLLASIPVEREVRHSLLFSIENIILCWTLVTEFQGDGDLRDIAKC
ncbi:hypothetical protein BUALT_Bualt10G0033300 [Buddleja alternifolia]|uniref:Uncharacterized protein n=1 Tax=Buddleja alternifolia TaxID=168488 RepID=A0AAV6X6G5_9LAMI|nr:hypothetical protein BUALT_Bualt10G0033300 [Buddleja alternifolia]